MSYAAAPTLTTARLVLRPPVAGDLPESMALWGDPAVMAFIGNGRPLSAEEVWSRLLRQVGGWEWHGYGYWTVRSRADGRFVGTVGFQNLRRATEPGLGDAPEIGWLVAAAQQGQGYGREAVAGALAWADASLSAPETVCIIRPAHHRSIRIAREAGYDRRADALYHGETLAVFARPKGFQNQGPAPTS